MPIPDCLTAKLQDAAAAAQIGLAVDVGEYTQGSIQVIGIVGGGATIQPQISNNGATWVDLGVAIVADVLRTIDVYFRFYRANCTIFTQDPVVDGPVTVILSAK